MRKLYFKNLGAIIAIGIMVWGNVWGQTIHLDPTTNNGGFESGTTGWTISNGTQANKWQVSTNATSGFSGSNCGYVSNTASAPFAHTYSNASSSVVHMYRDIAIPAGESTISISFKWIGNAEACCDRMRIWLCPTSFTPTSGSQVTGTGTAPTGRVAMNGTTTAISHNSQASWTTYTASLPAAYAGTSFRLLIEWRNDGSVGTNPPAGIDDITLTSSCTGAATAAASAIAATSATANWTAFAGATSYDLRHRAVGAPSWTTLTTLAGTSTSLSSLTSNTNYEYQVKANGPVCNAWSASRTFTTLCNPYSIPYTEGFETGYTHNTAIGGCNSQASVTGAEQWTANNAFTDYNRTPRTGSFNAFLRYSNEDWLFIPISLTGGTSYTASVYARQDGSVTTDANIAISYGTTNSAAGMTNSVVSATGINASYQLISGAFTPSSTGTYYLGIKGFMNGTPWYISLDDISIDVTPSCLAPTITATTTITSATATINWTAPSPAPSNGYQWEVRSSGAGGSGATGLAASGTVAAGVLTASAAGLAASTGYTVYVRSDCGGSGFSTWASGGAFTTLCSAPSVTGTTPATRCGTGTVTLAATASSGTLRWFKAATADTLRGTGASFVTPSIASTTDYYVEAATIGTASFGGKLTPETSWTGSTFSDWGIVFDVLKEGTLNSVDVYSSAAGTLNVKIVNSSNTELYSTGNVSVSNGGTTTPTTIPLNYNIGVGTGYKVLVKAFSGVSLIRGSTSLAFPYINSDLSITSSEWGGTTTGTYYYFHNFNFSPVCASARTLVTATVTPAPALALDSNNFSICKGATSTAVSVTAATLPDYNTFSWTPTTGVSSPSSSSTTFSPSATTTYTLNASHSGTGCARSLTRTITMADTPSRLTLSQGFVKPKCDARIDSLMASGGLVPQSGKIGSGTATNTSSTPFKRWFGGSRSQALYTPAELTALGLVNGSVISSIGWVALSGTPMAMGSTTNFSVTAGFVTSTTLGTAFITGDNNTVFSASGYVPSTGVGNLDFALSTPLTWDGTSHLLVASCFNNNDGGGVSSNNISVESTTVASGLNLYLSQDNTANVCTNTTAPTTTTNRPNLRLTYSVPNITWSPTTGLFTDRAASAAYTSGHAAKLYSKPSTTTKYYAQAQNGICIVRDSIIDSAKATTDMVILALGSASGAAAQCTDAGWTYYGTAADPDKLIFAIQKGAWTNGNETVTIGVNGSPYSSSLTTNGPNQHHRSWLMGRDWDVTVAAQPSSPVLVRFFYDPADTTAVNTDRDAAFAALPGGTIAVKTPFEWFKTTNVPYNAAWRSAIVGNKFPATHIKLSPTYGSINGVNYAEFSVASFSGGTGGAGFGPSGGGGAGVGLPVTWAGFDVKTAEIGNELTWKTASEQNTDYFEVQYSYDAKEFIAFPEHIPAAGNSADLRTYNLVHSDFAPFVYYRIKQVDLDGKFDYSVFKLAKRAAGRSFAVNVFPIPMQEDNLLHVSAKGIDKSTMSITMTDITGKVIRHLSYIPSSESIKESFDMSPLTPGLYFIEVQNGQGKEKFKVSR